MIVIGIDALRMFIELEGQYDRFTSLNACAIEPAIRELTTKANRIISWEPVRQNRKATTLRFTFKENPQIGLAREVRRS
jgi:hypothetical protein